MDQGRIEQSIGCLSQEWIREGKCLQAPASRNKFIMSAEAPGRPAINQTGNQWLGEGEDTMSRAKVLCPKDCSK